MTSDSVPEFRRMVALDDIGKQPIHRKLEANAEERAALARRFDLLALDSLTANLELNRVPGGPLISVKGRISATVVQRCVVTLEPAPGQVDDSLHEIFGPSDYQAKDDGDEEQPEPFEDMGIDTGELVAQCLSLSLDPYPRAPGAEAPVALTEEDESDTRRNPFAELAKLKKKH